MFVPLVGWMKKGPQWDQAEPGWFVSVDKASGQDYTAVVIITGPEWVVRLVARVFR